MTFQRIHSNESTWRTHGYRMNPSWHMANIELFTLCRINVNFFPWSTNTHGDIHWDVRRDELVIVSVFAISCNFIRFSLPDRKTSDTRGESEDGENGKCRQRTGRLLVRCSQNKKGPKNLLQQDMYIGAKDRLFQYFLLFSLELKERVEKKKSRTIADFFPAIQTCFDNLN